ncbi:unnamed protein product [Brassica oleracea var. botrytis]|uniref:HAT C-terminal dimerisation domain-containing protein n=1 Tax=Brassica oleracea TaxID=3712 RepID=A0A3P6D5T4_BRAOL|nr:unnamed protein product [Brassica oleracea]
MQVSSVASEYAFSTSNRILDPSRNCLTHYMIELLMCTRIFGRCEIRINEKIVVSNQQLITEIELQDELQKEFEPQLHFQT